jgi:hypothetical protein
MRPGRLQQIGGADEIGLDESGRPVDRPVDMRFGRQMHDDIRRKARNDFPKSGKIADVRLGKPVAVVLGNDTQRVQIACIGKTVDIQHMVIGFLDQHTDHG